MKSILLIEDSEIFQFLVEVVLSEVDSNITIHKAYDGEEALAMLFEQGIQPDLILLDINMPRMNGHEFLAEYNKVRSGNTPIVAMLTSSDQTYDKEKTSQYSFVKDYIVKPITAEHVSQLNSLVSQTSEVSKTPNPEQD